MAKDNAQAWGKIELDETKIGRLDHKIEKLQILELVPGVEFLRTDAASGSNGVTLSCPYTIKPEYASPALVVEGCNAAPISTILETNSSKTPLMSWVLPSRE